MKVELFSYTKLHKYPEKTIEDILVFIARVSSSRDNKFDSPEKLIQYLQAHKHWSPFTMADITFEIETTKDISIQLLRHKSFDFQEFSQRYQNVNILGDDLYGEIELRQQCKNNRQSSHELCENTLSNLEVRMLLGKIKKTYNELLDAGVARECARKILPMATKTKLYMKGSVRSWIHFLMVRDHQDAQKEMQELAQEIRSQLLKLAPNIFNKKK